jgi:hypothetical protein
MAAPPINESRDAILMPLSFAAAIFMVAIAMLAISILSSD